MKARLFITLLAASLIVSCSRSGVEGPKQRVSSAEGLVFEIPENLKPTHELHDFAGLQYGNEEEGIQRPVTLHDKDNQAPK